MAVSPGRRPDWSELALGLAVGVIGLWEAARSGGDLDVSLVIALAMAAAAGTYRLLPSLGVGLVWGSSILQVAERHDVMLVQLTVVIAAYGAARHGRPATLWISGLSIPLGAAIALVYVGELGAARLTDLGAALVPGGITSVATAFLLVFVVLSAPWALGLVLRLREQNRLAGAERERAETDAARAKEIAELRAEQARLARDVHDVVGHSLTVILAQADSVEFMADGDIAQIRAALTNISTSARRSLGDVRQVLSSTNDPTEGPPRPIGGLDSLIEGVSGAGNDLRTRVEGTPRPMSPELDVVAFRVLQEMLTNALKHGRRGAPIAVERSWGADDLRIEVRNVVADGIGPTPPDSIGEAGMRRRLEAVGGRLSVHRDDTPAHGPVFTATAWVPLRPRGGGG